MDHTSYATLSSFIYPHTLCIYVLIVWAISNRSGVLWHFSTYWVRTASHFVRFTPDSDFFHHTFCTVHTVNSVWSHLIITSSLCWCFTIDLATHGSTATVSKYISIVIEIVHRGKPISWYYERSLLWSCPWANCPRIPLYRRLPLSAAIPTRTTFSRIKSSFSMMAAHQGTDFPTAS